MNAAGGLQTDYAKEYRPVSERDLKNFRLQSYSGLYGAPQAFPSANRDARSSPRGLYPRYGKQMPCPDSQLADRMESVVTELHQLISFIPNSLLPTTL